MRKENHLFLHLYCALDAAELRKFTDFHHMFRFVPYSLFFWQMKEAFDPPASAAAPPEPESDAYSFMRNGITNDVLAEQDAIPSGQPCMCPGNFPSKRT
jgi:hypothetical protein